MGTSGVTAEIWGVLGRELLFCIGTFNVAVGSCDDPGK